MSSPSAPHERIFALATEYGDMTDTFPEKKNMIKLLNETIKIKTNKIKQLHLDLKRYYSINEQLLDYKEEKDKNSIPINKENILLKREYNQLVNDFSKIELIKLQRINDISILNKKREDLISTIKHNDEEASSLHMKTSSIERDYIQKRMHYHSLVKRVSTNNDRLDLLQSMHKAVTQSIEASIDAFATDHVSAGRLRPLTATDSTANLNEEISDSPKQIENIDITNQPISPINQVVSPTNVRFKNGNRQSYRATMTGVQDSAAINTYLETLEKSLTAKNKSNEVADSNSYFKASINTELTKEQKIELEKSEAEFNEKYPDSVNKETKFPAKASSPKLKQELRPDSAVKDTPFVGRTALTGIAENKDVENYLLNLEKTINNPTADSNNSYFKASIPVALTPKSKVAEELKKDAIDRVSISISEVKSETKLDDATPLLTTELKPAPLRSSIVSFNTETSAALISPELAAAGNRRTSRVSFSNENSAPLISVNVDLHASDNEKQKLPPSPPPPNRLLSPTADEEISGLAKKVLHAEFDDIGKGSRRTSRLSKAPSLTSVAEEETPISEYSSITKTIEELDLNENESVNTNKVGNSEIENK